MRINEQGFIELTEPNEIFVFGSNADGNHHGGAAKFALDNYGAIIGRSFGTQGRSFAIDTMSGIEQMKNDIEDFLCHASFNRQKTFVVTPIGCGIAGYKPEQIAPFFANAPENVFLPDEFKRCVGGVV